MNNFRFIIVGLFILILSLKTTGQGFGTLRGVVVDSTSGEALAFCNVFLAELNTGASTDNRGYFLIGSLPARRGYSLQVSYMGYTSRTIKVNISDNKITHLQIKLNPSTIQLQTVEKIGERKIEQNATDISIERITIKELETLPKGVEVDIFRSLQYLPGVRSTGDVSARYYVRGGSSNQNLVLLNGVTVYNPFHALGMFSVIDPEIINSFEFYKGGFPAEFGDRLSSVLNLVSKNGNKYNYSAKASTSLLTGKLLVEGPIPSGSFIVSGRKSYSTEILKKFLNDKNAPFDFYDLSFKVNLQTADFGEGATLTLHGFLSNDKLVNDNPQKEDFRWTNNLFGLQWFQVYDGPFFSELNLAISNFEGEVIPNFSNSRPRENTVQDVSLDFDFNYMLDTKDEIKVGLFANGINSSLKQTSGGGASSDISDFGTKMGMYAKYRFLRYDNFGLDIGSRLNVVGITKAGNFTFEPRITFTYNILPFVTLKGAWGLFNQEVTTLTNENEVISLYEPWVINPEYMKLSRATHYTAGIDIDFADGLVLKFETYYNIMHNIATYNDSKKYPEDPDLIPATGESYGGETMIRYKSGPVNITASYALAYAYKETEDWLYYPKYDSRNTLNLSLEYDFGNEWRASAVWFYSTGLPFTPLIGYYDKMQIGSYYEQWYIYDSYSPYSILGDKNISRLPDYHRLDINLSKKFNIGPLALSFDLSIVNVYDRKNIFYYKRDTGERVNMLPFLPTGTIKVEI